MVDICTPHPWARAQSQPSKGKKINGILLLFTLCSLFAPREPPDIITKQTRTVSVIFPPYAYQTETHKNKITHYNPVFLYTTAWGSHPHASLEGLGTTPSGKCLGGSTPGPLGAAMRPKALRQPPNESLGPMNPRLQKRMANIKDLPSPHVCHHKHPSPYSAKKPEN